MQYLDEYVPTTYLQYYMFPDEIVKESDPNYTRADEAKDSREKDVFETCAKAVAEIPWIRQKCLQTVCLEI